MALIEITNLKKHYSSGEDVVEALRGVDISINEGEFITIMGQSGSGKSTLLSVLGGMNHPTTGEVEMAGIKLYQLPGAEARIRFPVFSPDPLSDLHRKRHAAAGNCQDEFKRQKDCRRQGT